MVTADSSVPSGLVDEGVVVVANLDACQERCDLNDLCKHFDYNESTRKCQTFTDTNPVSGDIRFVGTECYNKQDPPTLVFAREPGECVRASGSPILGSTDRGSVANAAECK
jgi:hypothetical protein